MKLLWDFAYVPKGSYSLQVRATYFILVIYMRWVFKSTQTASVTGTFNNRVYILATTRNLGMRCNGILLTWACIAMASILPGHASQWHRSYLAMQCNGIDLTWACIAMASILPGHALQWQCRRSRSWLTRNFLAGTRCHRKRRHLCRGQLQLARPVHRRRCCTRW